MNIFKQITKLTVKDIPSEEVIQGEIYNFCDSFYVKHYPEYTGGYPMFYLLEDGHYQILLMER